MLGFCFLSLSIAITAQAAFTWQTKWPKSPMGTDIATNDNPNIAIAIKYFYEWGVGLGGVAVFIALIIAGFEYITSIGNPSKMQDAFNRIRDAVIGLVVLLSSYAVLTVIGINLTKMKVDMFQSSFDTPGGQCTSLSTESTAKGCCNDASGSPITGCNENYYQCFGWTSGNASSTGVCLPRVSKTECHSVVIKWEVTGEDEYHYDENGKQETIDSDKRIKSMKFKDEDGNFCYDQTSDDPAVNDPNNPVCNCNLQLFTKQLTVSGTNSNPCENADLYAAPNNAALKLYIKAKNVVCFMLVKS